MQEHTIDSPFTLMDGDAYYDALLKKLPKAKTRIVLAAMIILWGKKTDAVFAELEKAVNRGVRVHVLLDNYTRLQVRELSPRNLSRLRLKKTLLLLDELAQKGARVDFVGKLGINPFKGRCHVKITVIDDNSYSFGGLNFSDENFANSDYMLHSKSPEVADCLEQLADRIGATTGPMPDAEVALSLAQSILFDGGQQESSIIFERAVILADQAKKVYFVSQMAPSGALAHALRATDTTYYFTRPEQMPVPSSWGQAFDQQRYRIANQYQLARYIHAKFMLFELQNGEKALLSGSNNFSYRGVAYGTKEIALYSTDTRLWRQLYNFFEAHISGNKSVQ